MVGSIIISYFCPVSPLRDSDDPARPSSRNRPFPVAGRGLTEVELEVMKMRNQTKKVFAGLALFAATISVSSCATRESAINDLQNFSYELRDNSQYYTAKKWKKAVTKFGRIRREIARHDYTVAERQRIGKLEGDCARYMVRGAKDGVMDHVLGIGSEIQGILDAIGIKQ